MIVGTNGVVVDEHDRVLLIRRDDILTWALPGWELEQLGLPGNRASANLKPRR